MNCRNSSGTKVKYVSFNQDNSACIVVNEDGYKIVSLLPTAAPVDPDEDFNQESMRQNMEQEGYSMAERDVSEIPLGTDEEKEQKRVGLVVHHAHRGYSQVEMLSTTSLLFAVGSGESSEFSPRRVFVLDAVTGIVVSTLHFTSSVLAVRARRDRLVVVLESKAFIYNVDNLKLLKTVPTSKNLNGLIALSWEETTARLALPAPTQPSPQTSGPSKTYRHHVLLYNCEDLTGIGEIGAHDSEIAALSISSCGKFLATASEVGTVVRVFGLENKRLLYTLRRGTKPAKIYSLGFGPPEDSKSSNGSLHLFDLSHGPNSHSFFEGFKDKHKMFRLISDLIETRRSNVTIKVGMVNTPLLVAIAKPFQPIKGNPRILALTCDGTLFEYEIDSSKLSTTLIKKTDLDAL